MVKVTLLTNGGRKTDVVPESMTLRQIYDKHGVNYESCTNTVDSVPLRIGDLDKSLRELGVGETARLSSIVKMDNAAKITVAGSAAVVKSSVKLEDWEKALKHNPDVGLYDDNDDAVFKVSIEEGPGSLNAYGVTFSTIPTNDGYACVTAIIDPTEADKKKLVADKMGRALGMLIELEESMPEIIEEANAFFEKVNSSIETV